MTMCESSIFIPTYSRQRSSPSVKRTCGATIGFAVCMPIQEPGWSQQKTSSLRWTGAATFGFAWADQGLCRATNDYVVDAVSRRPDRLLGFAVVNPAGEGADQELERSVQKGLCGIGELMPDGQGYALDDPRLDDIVELATRWKRPVLIHAGEPIGHTYPGKSKSTLQGFYALALRHPEAVLVAAHWGGGLLFYELMPEVRQVLKNVFYDTAASLYLYDEAIFSLAARLVPDKVLFGTDYPLIDQERFLRCIRRSGLTPSAQQSMMGGNAARVLR